MRFRYIDIPKLVLQLLRPNYSVRRDHSYTEQPFWTTIIYRYCLSLLMVLHDYLYNYYMVRSKWYMMATCTPTYGQIEGVLRYWYGEWGRISITPSGASIWRSMWYDSPNPPVCLYDTPTPKVYLGQGGTITEQPIIAIPAALYNNSEAYNQFIADVNTLFPFYIKYTIKTQ
jgi:hypothetical protein